ncbi:uncharacterized protein M6B38_251375 [Iris pallida]|uniref:CCHC-type domain-containing protein n=1 Tax=Iris pallida TaxID=29817 RepID=A0AAX6IIV5_IRIPA|nr:uncharacterized protein M6B38_251375 [Iris pallida]
MVETRSQRPGQGDAGEGSSTSRPRQQAAPPATGPVQPLGVGASAAFGGAPPPVGRPSMVIPEILLSQQPPPAGMVDAAHLFSFVERILESSHQRSERQTADFRQGIDEVHQLVRTTVEMVTGQGAQQQPRRRERDIQDFQKMHPREFFGTEGIHVADDWVEHIEEIFRLAEIPARLHIEAAGSQIQDLARAWYQTDPRVGVEGQTWAQFKELFKEQFFPDVALGGIEAQFEALVQGNQTVAEYAGEFCRLARYIDDLTEKTKARKFRRGLIREIRSLTKSDRNATFAEIYSGAMAAEDDLGLRQKRGRDFQSGSSSQGQAKRPHFQQQQQRPVQQYQQQHQQQRPVQQHQQQRGQQAPRQLVICAFCKKPGHMIHECRKKLGKCLLCGAGDHQLRDCPGAFGRGQQGGGAKAPAGQQRGPALQTQQQRFQQHQQQARGGQQGRAFAMAAEDAEVIGELIADVSNAGCSTYYGVETDGDLGQDCGLIVEPLDFIPQE